ncbi:MAG: hypothetical protein NT051_01200 [Candidatus Micrarchaeota archaeon]|nr:hypothetical protein [Candidatus Micrarchaeota archaeon]
MLAGKRLRIIQQGGDPNDPKYKLGNRLKFNLGVLSDNIFHRVRLAEKITQQQGPTCTANSAYYSLLFLDGKGSGLAGNKDRFVDIFLSNTDSTFKGYRGYDDAKCFIDDKRELYDRWVAQGSKFTCSEFTFISKVVSFSEADNYAQGIVDKLKQNPEARALMIVDQTRATEKKHGAHSIMVFAQMRRNGQVKFYEVDSLKYFENGTFASSPQEISSAMVKYKILSEMYINPDKRHTTDPVDRNYLASGGTRPDMLLRGGCVLLIEKTARWEPLGEHPMGSKRNYDLVI